MSSRYLSATSGMENSRKNSADSNFSHSGNSYYSAGESVEHINQRLPPSRSEDTLVLSNKKHSTPLHRKRATTVNTSFSGDTTPITPTNQSFSKKGTDSTTNLTNSDPDAAVADNLNGKITTSTPNSSVNLPKESATNKKDDAKHSVSLFPEDSSCFKEQLFIAETENAENLAQPLPPDDFPSTNPFSKSAFDRKQSSSQKSSPEHSKKRTTQQTASPRHQHNDDDDQASTSNSGMPGIIQVFAAYDTGLASGTSLKLHVTPKTTAREVVDLVVKQLNMAVVLKGKDGPIYAADKFDNFCLVAVIGARERCLRDDFKPLQLQNPWKKGRLYVRQKHDLLAAIEHSNRDAQLI